MKNLILIITLFLVSIQAVDLTNKEIEFLKNNPTIKVHNEQSWAPYNFNENGMPKGFVIDYMNLVAKKLNIKIEYISGYSWDEFLNLIDENKIDVISNIVKTKDRAKYINFTSVYHISKKAIFSNMPNLNFIKDLNGKTVAVPKNFFIHNYLVENYPNIKIKHYKNILECIVAVLNKEADAVIENYTAINYLMQKNGLTLKYATINEDEELITNFRIGTAKDKPILRDIFQKTMNSITNKEVEEIQNRWFGVDKKTTSFFTKEQKEYLENKKVLKVHVEKDWVPFNYIQNKEVKGFANDYMKLLGDKIGIDIEFVTGYSWSEYMQLLKDKKIDIISTMTNTSQRQESYIFSKEPMFDIMPSLVTKEKNKHLNLENLKGKKLAVVKGYYSSEYLKQYYPQINLVESDTNLGILNLVLNGDADAAIGTYAVLDYLIYQNFLSGLKNSFIINNKYFKRTPQYLGLNKDQKILKQIIDKAMNNIDQNKLNTLKEKWIVKSKKEKEKTVINLSKVEKEYLENKKEIKMCVDPNWMPLEKIDENGNYMGILSEYIKLFSSKTDIKFMLEKTKSYKQSREYLESNRCDIIVGDVAVNYDRDLFLTTKPYFTTPRAFAIHSDTKGVQSFSQIALDGKIGVLVDSPAEAIIKEIYKDIEIVSFKSTAKGLIAVAKKQIIAYIEPITSIAYNIQNQGLLNVHIGGIFKSDIKLSVVINKNEQPLLSILNKTISTISETDKINILNKWVKVTYKKSVDYTLVWQIVILFLIVVIIGILFVIVLKKKVKEEVEKNRQKEKMMLQQSRLAQMGEIISMIAHQWRQPLNGLSMLNSSLILKYSRDKLDKEFLEYFKLNSKKQIHNMSKTIDDFRDFFKPEKEKQEFIINETIQDTIDMVKPFFSDLEIELIFYTKEEITTIGYQNELGQGIINIINNAKDVLVENEIENKQINITLTQDDKDITLSISDNAGGIPDNIIDKIFDPYFSTKDEKNGTGLGLYMTKMIVEDHMDGKLSVSNNKAGAEFKIILKRL